MPQQTKPLTAYQTTIGEFIEQLNKRDTTKRTYKEALGNWNTFANEEAPNVDVELVEAYKTHLTREKYSPYTIGVYLTALKLFFDYLVSKGVLQINPAEHIERNKKPKSRRESLTEEEFFRLIELDSPQNKLELRDRAILMLKMCAGLRDISIVRTDVGDIRTKGGVAVLYHQGKGRDSKDEFVVLTTRVFKTLTDYLNQRPAAKPADPLFISGSKRNRNQRITSKTIYRAIKNFFKLVQIKRPGITPHSLRHTAVTFAILGGADVPQVQDMAGHKHIETTMEYRHNLERLTDPAEQYIERYIEKHQKQL